MQGGLARVPASRLIETLGEVVLRRKWHAFVVVVVVEEIASRTPRMLPLMGYSKMSSEFTPAFALCR